MPVTLRPILAGLSMGTGEKGSATSSGPSRVERIKLFVESRLSIKKPKISGLDVDSQKLEKATQNSQKLAQFALNNPSDETKELVKSAFKGLGKLLSEYNLTPEDLDLLLNATPDARSIYSKKHTPDRAVRLSLLQDFIAQLKDFENVDDFDEHFSQYAAEFETLMTAIGYTAVGKGVSSFQQSQEVKNLLKDFKESGFLVSYIAQEEFPHRTSEYIFSPLCFRKVTIRGENQAEVAKGLPGRQKGLPSSSFSLESYVSRALEQGIPMRAHVSGSASVTLAMTRFALKNSGQSLDEKTLLRAAGILCATYELGDYHSIAETAAGSSHFYQSSVQGMNFRNTEGQILEQIDPVVFLGLGIGYLSMVVHEEKMGQFDVLADHVISSYSRTAPDKPETAEKVNDLS